MTQATFIQLVIQCGEDMRRRLGGPDKNEILTLESMSENKMTYSSKSIPK